MQQLHGEDAQLNQQAMMLKRAGDSEKAIPIYKDLISKNPLCNDLYYNLAKVYTVMNATNDALVYYMKSIHLDLIDCNNFDSGLPDQYWDIINAFNIEKDSIKKLLFRTDFVNPTRNIGKMLSGEYSPQDFIKQGSDISFSYEPELVNLESVEGPQDALFVKSGILFALEKLNWSKICENNQEVLNEYNNSSETDEKWWKFW